MRGLMWLMGVTALALLSPRLAQADVPGRVGRIAFMQGDVQAYSEAEPEWKVAYINQPITSRNSVFVGDGGRAEITVGSTTLALDEGSQVDVQELDDNTFNANVVRGRVSLRVRRIDANDVYNVAVPGAAFALLKPGRYRIDALDAAGGITVFAGQASVQSDRGAMLVDAGNALRVTASPSDPNAPPELVAVAPAPAALDDWVMARESRFRAGPAERYVSPNMTGYEDLDANGRWSTEADVGPVWYPTTYVHTDWAPYRYGRWAYVAPWGYTWIDDAPWGFAPFHYGRWLQVGGRWGWCPGAYVARPAFAPALVGFYGGPGFSASFSVGAGPAVGWYPLAPWQRYSPHYTRSATYINQVNNITIVNAPPRFAHGGGGREFNREHGGTIVPQDAFASQRSISRVAIAAPGQLTERAAPVNVVDLPRPAQIPGAVRRGPEAFNGTARPEFRPPREFATRHGERDGRFNEGGGRPAAVVGAPASIPEAPRSTERGSLPPNYRRLPDERRPAVGVEAARPVQPNAAAIIPGERAIERPWERNGDRNPERGIDRGIPQPRGPNQPGFNRETRPLPQQTAPAIEAPAAAIMPNPQRFAPRMQPVPSESPAERARPQMQMQPPGGERAFERPMIREPRNAQPQMQPPQPLPQPAVQAPAIERPQRFERAAPPAPVAPVAPVAAPAAQPRQQPQRGEPEGQPERGERGPMRRDR